MKLSLMDPQRVTTKRLNFKQELFCKIYATDPECIGNQSFAYMKAYGTTNVLNARVSATEAMKRPEIVARINEYLSQEGFNDQSVDKKHNFLIHQHKDLGVALKAIQEYNKLKKRVDNMSINLIMPKPIMELDEDETIHKIDKKKAIDVTDSQ